jgi:putative copper resistance protein D
LSGRYVATVTLHVLAAVLWLGGMLFFALAAPVLRSVADDAVRASLFDQLGRRFRTVGWVCVAILVATGLEQLRVRGWWGAEFWRTGLLETALGRRLALKLGLVVAMIMVQAAHDFWLGPRAGRALPGSSEARSLRRGAAWLARGNALLGVLLVYAAVRLAR